MNRRFAIVVLASLSIVAAWTPPETAVTWTFDRLDRIGGHPTTLLGNPRVVDTPKGKAIEFDGVDDAIYVPNHPLAGASAFTWEAVFRPDGGAEEQRWFHLSEQDQAGADTGTRMLYEIRVINGRWCLDSFVQSGSVGKALMDRSLLHSLGEWHHVASVYDGSQFSNYVDGKLQVSGQVKFAPQGKGRSSIGVRINKVNYFKGAVLSSRFTHRALKPDEFMKW